MTHDLNNQVAKGAELIFKELPITAALSGMLPELPAVQKLGGMIYASYKLPTSIKDEREWQLNAGRESKDAKFTGENESACI
ncbi:hypothetical protein [Paenibacillus sp. J2TS4]|uniref:hypothetical protein n=1 Tax=Paenibacillus sp. J2TS4 TaxID=2807194 RepID=UPI001B0023EA|nr:hypothetical protein [Paenibacillus sp. J2TS4]GIP31937.1 hypothetical protein J2TS4_11470 [Paenibacillus sp. J2TS4]